MFKISLLFKKFTKREITQEYFGLTMQNVQGIVFM